VKPVTVICLAGLGLSLVHPGNGSRFVFSLAVAALTMPDLSGVDDGINRWLMLQATPGPEAVPLQMMNRMPLAIVLAGGSLALSRLEGHHFAATALRGLACVMAAFAVLAHLTRIHILYGSLNPRPLPTAIGVLRRRRNSPADRNNARALQAATAVAPADHARSRDYGPAPVGSVRVVMTK
jgi:hypothetical protein